MNESREQPWEGRGVSVWVEVRRFLFLRRYLVRQLVDGRPVTVQTSFSARAAARHCARLLARAA